MESINNLDGLNLITFAALKRTVEHQKNLTRITVLQTEIMVDPQVFSAVLNPESTPSLTYVRLYLSLYLHSTGTCLELLRAGVYIQGATTIKPQTLTVKPHLLHLLSSICTALWVIRQHGMHSHWLSCGSADFYQRHAGGTVQSVHVQYTGQDHRD